MQGGPIDVHVVWGAPIVFEATTDRKAATAAAEAEVRAALRGIGAGGDGVAPAPNVRPAASDLGLQGQEIATV